MSEIQWCAVWTQAKVDAEEIDINGTVSDDIIVELKAPVHEQLEKGADAIDEFHSQYC